MGEHFDLINDAKAENVEVVALKLSKPTLNTLAVLGITTKHFCKFMKLYPESAARLADRIGTCGLEQIDLEDLRQAIADAGN